jgi:hypothetical protein
MSIMTEKELHSKSSLDTNNLDLEKGEAVPHREEEESVHAKVHLG